MRSDEEAERAQVLAFAGHAFGHDARLLRAFEKYAEVTGPIVAQMRALDAQLLKSSKDWSRAAGGPPVSEAERSAIDVYVRTIFRQERKSNEGAEDSAGVAHAE
jgi:hypothetical protein